jgi:hypothetical protein
MTRPPKNESEAVTRTRKEWLDWIDKYDREVDVSTPRTLGKYAWFQTKLQECRDAYFAALKADGWPVPNQKWDGSLR